MKNILLLTVTIVLFYSCANRNYCSKNDNYLSKVDTTKPYKIEGVFCVSEIKNKESNEEHGNIAFSIFDRISGKKIEDGVVWLVKNDTTKIKFNKLYDVPVGRYTIYVSNANNLPLKITKFDIAKDKIYKINCYLGNSLQW